MTNHRRDALEPWVLGRPTDAGAAKHPSAAEVEICPLCGRELIGGTSVNEHHLIPRTYGGKQSVQMHRVCHSKIHAVFNEKELRDHYHTFERLRAHPEIASFIKWVRKQPPGFNTKHRKGKA